MYDYDSGVEILRLQSKYLERLPGSVDKPKEFFVVHQNDPDCRRKVTITKNQFIYLMRYLYQQKAYKQYTQEDMLVKLGYQPPSWPQLLFNNNELVPQHKNLSLIHQSPHEIRIANLHVCLKYEMLTYVDDELGQDDINPYVVLMRSGDYFQEPINAYTEYKQAQERFQQIQAYSREKDLKWEAMRKINEKQAQRERRLKQAEGNCANVQTVLEPQVKLPTKKPKKDKNKLLLVLTAPIRWLRKHF